MLLVIFYNYPVIVFRGTEPWLIKNWISDINFIAEDYPLCDNSIFLKFIFQNAKYIEDSIMHIQIFKIKSQINLDYTNK